MATSDSGFGGPFWERKVKSFLRRMDADGDGYITKKDYERLADRYTEMAKLDDVKAKQVRRKLVKVWYDYFESDAVNGRVDETVYIQVLKDRKELIFETALQFHGMFFDLIDLNGDGFIQKEEFALFFRVFGIEDEQLAHQTFEALDVNGDGQLSYDEFTHAGFQFFHSGDESLPSKLLYGPITTE